MGGRRRWSGRRWVLAVVGLLVVLVAPTVWLWNEGSRGAEIANVLEFPVSVLALFGALAAALAGRSAERDEPPPRRGSSWAAVRRLVTAKAALAAALALVLVVVSAWWGPALANRAAIWAFGCEHPTQLRVLTGPDQVEPVRQLTDRYERWTAERNYGCPTASGYVYAASGKAVRDALVARWPGTSLRDVGPQPDVWFAGSAAEVDRVRAAAQEQDVDVPIRQDDTIAWSPIVLAVSAPAAPDLGEQTDGLDWPDYLRRTATLGWDLVRPDPVGSPVGELGTAALYGTETLDLTRARMIEQRIGRSLDDGGYPLGSDLDILCRYRQLDPPRTAVVASEQALVRFNRGDPLGTGCGSRAGRRTGDDALLAFYPSGTRAVEHRFVRFGWSGPPQDAQAAAFGRWLAGDDGKRALLEAGLRPPGVLTADPLSRQNGVRPEANFERDPVAGEALAGVLRLYDVAHRRGRVLLALDGSGSMGAAAGSTGVSRFAVAGRGALTTLELMGERDEFGLWIFPADPSGTGAREAVPIGPRDGMVGAQPRRRATGAALDQARPAGGTPLFRTIVDGAAAVGPSDDTRVSALVVLTDGEDTTSGLAPDQVRDAVQGRNVRLFVIAVGEATCAAVALEDVAAATGGRCVDADLASVETKLTELFSALWSVG